MLANKYCGNFNEEDTNIETVATRYGQSEMGLLLARLQPTCRYRWTNRKHLQESDDDGVL